MILALLAALAISVLDWRMTGARVSEYCGYGAITGTLRRDNPAPMRYRVLVPWLMKLVYRIVCRRPVGVAHYQVLKGALLAAALVAVQAIIGTPGMLLLAVLIASTLEFDYWDSYAELLGLALVLSGNLWLAGLGALLWGLSRETAALAPIIAYTAHGWPAGLVTCAAPVTMLAVRLYQGQAQLYCRRFMLFEIVRREPADE
jgi:hypothetical protein